MNTTVLNRDLENYIGLFYEPKLSAYALIKAFFAELYKLGTKRIRRDLTDFFLSIKHEDKYKDVLREIKFKSNGIFQYSNELEDSIFTLQNAGLLGKENPSFGVILIKYNDSIADEIISSTPEEFVPLIKEIASKYKTYEK